MISRDENKRWTVLERDRPVQRYVVIFLHVARVVAFTSDSKPRISGQTVTNKQIARAARSSRKNDAYSSLYIIALFNSKVQSLRLFCLKYSF